MRLKFGQSLKSVIEGQDSLEVPVDCNGRIPESRVWKQLRLQPIRLKLLQPVNLLRVPLIALWVFWKPGKVAEMVRK